MVTATAIATSITPDAAARVAELGMETELRAMLEHAERIVPHLRSVRVTLEYDPEGELEPQVVIWSNRDDRDWNADTSEWDFGSWKVRTFPPDVCLNFVMITCYEAAHAR
jgi:hypothetical protein